ncbi:MAG: DUF962 domain-containing protein [Vicinamibacteria bacterium]
MSPTLRSQFADYAAFHATPGNRACHYVGIPLIVFTLVALLTRVPLANLGSFTLTLAEVIVAVVTLWYLTLDVPLAIVMLVVTTASAFWGRSVPALLALVLFVVGWIFQFVGHYVYEKRSPAFYKNLMHLLVGPLWIAAKATRRA